MQMDNTLYETLGVNEDASPDELKRAYRQKAHALHPDKGGNAEDFAALGYAYRVLRDPGSRLLYDKTGSGEPPKMDKMVREVLDSAFSSAILVDAPKLLDHVREIIDEGERIVAKQKESLLIDQTRLLRKKKQLYSKGPTDIFKEWVEAQLRDVRHTLAGIEQTMEVGARVRAILDSYISLEPDPEPPPKPPFGGMSFDMITMGEVEDVKVDFRKIIMEEMRRQNEQKKKGNRPKPRSGPIVE